MRRSLVALGAAVLSMTVARCARRVPAPAEAPPSPVEAPSRSEATPPPPRFATRAEGEPELLVLEDRRDFEPAVVAAAAASSDAALRSRTALAIGRIGDPRGAATLERLLSDAEPGVRTAAAFAAGLLGEPSLIPDLARRLSDGEAAVAARAAWSLGFLERDEAESALLSALSAGRTAEGKAALARPLWHYATPQTAAALSPLASDPNPAVRAAALYALARRPREESLTILTGGLADPDADTAALCARALGLLGKPEAIPPLSAAVADRRAPVTIFAMAALQAILEKNPSARPASLAPRVLGLAGDANPNLAVPALSLCRFFLDDAEVFRRLFAIASSGMGRRRQVALGAVIAALGEKSLTLADAAIASPDPFLRGATAEALAFLPEASAAPRRARLAADPEAIVRIRLLDGLRTASDVRSHRALVDGLLADSDVGVRAAALDALGRIEDPGVLPVLRAAVEGSYGDAAPDVPIAAIGAAQEQAPAPEARAVVEAAYRHPSVLVSRLARRSLAKSFRADPAAFPPRPYSPGKTVAEYGALLSEARKPWSARVETARGAFRIRLAGAEAPVTVMNFLGLARKGYFDGAPIHRVVPGFVVQDGDPTGTGSGGPGYEIRDEINAIAYDTGTVGMALAGPDTGGSQWFVTVAPQPHLDGAYTVFGRVTAGMDVVGRIEQGDRILRVTVGETP